MVCQFLERGIIAKWADILVCHHLQRRRYLDAVLAFKNAKHYFIMVSPSPHRL